MEVVVVGGTVSGVVVGNALRVVWLSSGWAGEAGGRRHDAAGIPRPPRGVPD